MEEAVDLVHVLIATGRAINLDQMFEEEREENLGAFVMGLRSVGAEYVPRVEEQDA